MKIIAKAVLSLALMLSSVAAMAQNIVWHNPQEESQNMLWGQAFSNELKGCYNRLPERFNPSSGNKDAVKDWVWGNSRHSAGLTLRFQTNSSEIRVRYGLRYHTSMPHMTKIGSSGIDLYATDNDGGIRWCAPANSGMWGKDTVEFDYRNISYIYRNEYNGYDYELYLPLYDEVTWLEIGTEEGKNFRYYAPTQELPIVVYGTSIAHGACASRPGMAWTAILHRETQHPLINFGFSGSGRLEMEMFDVLAATPASLYIIDCLPNMQDSPLLEETYTRTIAGVHRLKQVRPETPVLLVEHSGYCGENASASTEERYRRVNREFLRAYRTLQSENIDGLYYLTKEEIGLSQDAMVEGIHPTDLGMRQYADAYIKKVREIFHEDFSQTFFPRTQNRDSYNWFDRHEEVIRLNHAEQPDIVLIGNSITHYWGGTPESNRAVAQNVWDSLFKGHKARNMGFGWDRVENVLWRVSHGELDGFSAKKIFLLLGTNNLETNTNDEIISGIEEVVNAVKFHQPQAKIYVCGIMPRSWQEPRVRNYNADLQRRLKPCDATFVDITKCLVNEDGTIINELFRDGLHPNEEGYKREAEMLKPFIEE